MGYELSATVLKWRNDMLLPLQQQPTPPTGKHVQFVILMFKHASSWSLHSVSVRWSHTVNTSSKPTECKHCFQECLTTQAVSVVFPLGSKLSSFYLNALTCRRCNSQPFYWGADKYLARTTSRCILFDGQNISFDASLVIYINSTNIPPIMIINRIYETQNLLSL